MISITVRFYEELNDFLPAEKRKTDIAVALPERQTVKHIIETLGVPHAEVDLVLAGGLSVPFGYRPRDGDRISVYPVFESLDIGGEQKLRERPLRDLRFVADVQLGKLARHLRMMGFDCLYRNDTTDAEVVGISVNEGRVILTKDKGLLMRSRVMKGYYVRSAGPAEQAAEVVSRFQLQSAASPFSRCTVCNGPLAIVEKKNIEDRIPPLTRKYYDDFRLCPGCGRVYWKGGHYERMLKKIDALLGRPAR